MADKFKKKKQEKKIKIHSPDLSSETGLILTDSFSCFGIIPLKKG